MAKTNQNETKQKVRGAEPLQQSVSTPRWTHLLLLAGLLAANAGLYWSTIHLGFLSVDDPDYVQNNPFIHGFTAANLKHILTTPYAANYAPANLLSYALDVTLAGSKSAFAVHLSSMLWHGFTVCMVYLLAWVIRGEILTATVAAALFLLHPAHVEVVAWISSRKDLVATSFAVLSTSCYLLYRRSATAQSTTELNHKPSSPSAYPRSHGTPAKRQNQPPTEPVSSGRRRSPALWYAATIFAFLVASAGKQSVLLLPAVLLLWDGLVEKRRGWLTLADKVPFGLITVFFGWMTWHAQPGTNQTAHVFVLADTVLTNLWLLTGFGSYVTYRVAPDPAAWSALGRAAVLAGALLVWFAPGLWLYPRRPVRAVFCWWMLVHMVPPMLLSFIVPITDRYLFLPSVGICILLADLAGSCLPSARKTSLATAFAPYQVGIAGILLLTACVWGAKTWNYLQEWSDPRSVWYGAHLKTKSSQVSQFLGEVYQTAGDRVNEFITSGKAADVTNEFLLAEAVLADPAQAEALRNEWIGHSSGRTNSLGYRDELWKLAWNQYSESLIHRGTLSTPNLFMNRGRLLVSQGKYERAIPEFQNALAFAQNSTYEVIRQESGINAMRAIGVAYWNMHKYGDARQWYLKAQDVQKKSGQTWVPTLDEEVRKISALAAGQP
jgi:hypothetical protein